MSWALLGGRRYEKSMLWLIIFINQLVKYWLQMLFKIMRGVRIGERIGGLWSWMWWLREDMRL